MLENGSAPEEKIKITVEDGEELVCTVLGLFDAGDRSYIALLPDEDDDEENNVLLYRYADETGELSDIESDDEYEEFKEVFLDIFLDEDDEDDDEDEDEDHDDNDFNDGDMDEED